MSDYHPLKRLYPADWATWSPHRQRSEEARHRAIWQAQRKREKADELNLRRFQLRDRVIKEVYEQRLEAARQAYRDAEDADPENQR